MNRSITRQSIGTKLGEGMGKMFGGNVSRRANKEGGNRLGQMPTGDVNKAVLSTFKAGADASSGALSFKNGGLVPATHAGKSAVGPARRRGRMVLRGIYNRRPREFRCGGKVSGKRNMTKWQRKNDSIAAILQPGELVVPVKYYQKGTGKPIDLAAETIKKFKEIGIKLPNT